MTHAASLKFEPTAASTCIRPIRFPIKESR